MSKKQDIKHISLQEIKDPAFLHELSYKELNVLSDDVREYIVDKVSKNGGHLASNLGVIESTVALLRSFDFTKDKLIFDVGHQCYAYKLLTGRSLERLRQKDGPAGFPRIDESIYDHYETGHSSTSISAAMGMAIARDLNKEDYNVVAFIGDASIVNGLAMEGLNNLGQSGHKVIIVLNDNDMSITKPVGALARSFRSLSNSLAYRRGKSRWQRNLKKTRFGRWLLKGLSRIKNWFKRHLMALNVFDFMGISYLGPIDGHSIKDLEKAFSKAKKLDTSCVIHIKTIKGKGYKLAENDDSGKWHGVGAFDKESGELNKDPNLVSWSKQYASFVEKALEKNGKSFLICPATGTGSSLDPIYTKFPDRCLDVGIAEEHAITMASGLSISGYHPIISMYSTFLQRAYDEISHDLARMNLNATILVDRAGLVGNDGTTHQGIYDEQFLLGIPNTVVAMASRVSEAEALMDESFKRHGVFCIRFPRESFYPHEEKEEITSFGKWKVELNSGTTAIVSMGPVVLQLKDYIIKNNMHATLYNAIYLKPMDNAAIQELLKYNKVIIYDPYATEKGFASYLASELIEHKYKGEVIIKAVPDVFVKHASIKEQREEFGITNEDIAKLL